jgi:hypothetical protein
VRRIRWVLRRTIFDCLGVLRWIAAAAADVAVAVRVAMAYAVAVAVLVHAIHVAIRALNL